MDNRRRSGKTTSVSQYNRLRDKKEVTDMVLDRIALVLVVIGALNWGVIGLFGLDLVAFVCGGQMAVLSRVIYALVGLGGLWCISLLFRENIPSEATA